MSWWTRKQNKPKQIQNYPTPNTVAPSAFTVGKYTPRSKERQQFFKKFAEEIVNVFAPKANTPKNNNGETEALLYLRKLYQELNSRNDRNLIQRRLRNLEFETNTQLTPSAKAIIKTKLRLLMKYDQHLQNLKQNINVTRKNRRTKTNFSTSSVSSLPSLENLKRNVQFTPKKRLQGVVIKPSPNTESLRGE